MRIKLCIVLLAVTVTAGCMTTMHFYPVQGPLSTATPVPVLAAKVSGINSGTISLALNSGEVCNGKWELVYPPGHGKAAPDAGDPSNTGDMASVWDSVYGKGFYRAHILGTVYAQSVAYGKRGATVDLQLYKSGEGVKGVAKDNNGNVYKVVGY